MSGVAAIDCGTNSIRLLIAEPAPGGGLVDRDRRLEIVRLGQGVDAMGEFHPDALTRTFAAVDRYAALIADAGIRPDRTHFVATSATRDAKNRDQFSAGIRQRLGVTPDVISGQREAELSFTGALSRVTPDAEPVLVMDIGGGSTELITGSAQGEMDRSVSLDIGSVRLTERFLHGNPVSAQQRRVAEDYADDQLDECPIDFPAVRTWIGVAGTATTVAAVSLGLAEYDREKVHGSTVPQAELTDLLERMCSMSVAEIRELPGMHPQRADVITAGTLIASRVALRCAVDHMLVSESDILDGIALALLREGSPQ